MRANFSLRLRMNFLGSVFMRNSKVVIREVADKTINIFDRGANL